jgi:HK97 family phage prohead protease
MTAPYSEIEQSRAATLKELKPSTPQGKSVRPPHRHRRTRGTLLLLQKCFRGEKMLQQTERRMQPTKIELRTEGGKPILSGYAAVFNQWSLPLSGGFREKLQRGCFAGPLSERQDTLCIFNHQADNILGRVKNKSLRLNEDSHGLYFECALPDTTIGRDVRANVESGLVDGCSFGFVVGEDEWGDAEDETGRFAVRTVTKVAVLVDASPVCSASYPQTSCTVSERALAEARSLLGRNNVVSESEKNRLLKAAMKMRLDWAAKEIRKDDALSPDDPDAPDNDEGGEDHDTEDDFRCENCGATAFRCVRCGTLNDGKADAD